MQIGSLFMALGFDVDDKKLDEFSEKVDGLRSGLLGVSGTAAAGVAALSAMSVTASNTALSIKNIADQTRSSEEEIQRFYSVLRGAYPKAELQDALGIMTALRDTIADAEFGEGATGIGALLGITDIANMTELQLLEAMREAVDAQSFSKEKVDQLIEQMGFPRDFGRVLRMPETQFQELYQREIIDEREQQALEDFAFALEEATYQLGQLKNNLGAIFAPIAERVMKPIGNVLGAFNEHINKQNAELEANKNKPRPSPLVQGDNIGYFEAWGKLLMDIVGYNPDRWIENRINQGMAVPERDLQRYINQSTNYNNTNNFNVETTADPREVAEQLINLSNERQNRGDISELPNTATGGTR